MTEVAEGKRMSEKNLNETNQNREKDHIRADGATADVVFAESEGFISHVHLVKSIFHRSSCERKCMQGGGPFNE